MNREYNSRVSKNSEGLLKNLKNMTGDYFFAAPCRPSMYNLQLSALMQERSVSAAAHRFLFAIRMPTILYFSVGTIFFRTNVVC